MRKYLFILLLLIVASCSKGWFSLTHDFPRIVKQGTIDLDIVETSPVVFNNRLYRFEYIREGYYNNQSGDSFFRFVDVESGDTTTGFAPTYHLGNAFVWQDSMYVTAVHGWGADHITLFMSADLENWTSREVLDLPGNTIFNTSLCRNDSAFVLMYEIGEPFEEAGSRFTARFAFSNDLHTWQKTSADRVYTKDRYSAPHALRYHNGYYYNFYLEQVKQGYQTWVVRSENLTDWELSKGNPVLKASAEDKVPLNNKFTGRQLELIKEAVNINNSDIDFCYFGGQLVIYYSWGDQKGTEFLAQAYFSGTEEEFLEKWFE